MGVLRVVGPAAVAVLEVDPQVLDRLGGELGQYQRADLGRYLRGESHRGRELAGPGRELLERGDRLRAPQARHAGPEMLRRDVGRVHGLPAEAVARVRRGQLGVRHREQLVELIGDIGEDISAERAGHERVPVISSGLTGTRARSRPVAARMAATIAGPEEIVGGSPTPRSPYGACGSGYSSTSIRIGGTSRMVGIR